MNFWNDYNYSYITNRAGQTVQWHQGDNEETFAGLSPKFKTYGRNEISYTFNSLGFRSQEFDDSLPIKILYGGCSLTEGTGLPIEHTWAWFLNDIISEKIGQKIAHTSVGRGGASIDAIVRYTYVTIEHKHFHPDVVMLLLPSVMRSEHPIVDFGNLVWYDYIPNFGPDNLYPSQLEFFKHFSVITNPLQRFLDSFKGLLMLKWYLQAKGIKFFFGFWDTFQWVDPLKNELTGILQMMEKDCPPEFKEHFFRGGFTFDLQKFYSGKPLIKKFPYNVARDGIHYGPNSHYSYATYFFEEIERREAFQQLLSKWSTRKVGT